MSKSIRDTKKRGRPATTGAGIQIGARWHEPEVRAIDEWRRKQPDQPSRAQAVRLLVTAMLHILAKDPGEKSARAKKR
jgi:hypothetical protein